MMGRMTSKSAGPVTRALLRIVRRIDPSPPVLPGVLQLQAERKIFNYESALTELGLAIA
jgi:hypothetical protein